MKRTILSLLILSAIFVSIVAPLWLGWPTPVQVQTSSTSDSLTMIYAILDGDKKDCRLLDNWREAPIVMLEAARKYDIDPFLLPVISRVEGPTPAMLKACNIYGLERRGKLLEFISHYYATDAAASILAKHKPKYDNGGLVDVEKLAAIWCPINRERWASNMKAIYERALCSTAK